MTKGIKTRRAWWSRVIPPPALGTELTPHAVLFATPANFNHAQKVKADGYKGLLYVESFGGGAGNDGRLLVVWRDHAAFDAAKDQFLQDTGLTNMLWEGYHLDNRQPGKPWWRRMTLTGIWAAVATISLVLSNLQTIYNGRGWLVGPPLIETNAPTAGQDVLVGDPFNFEVSARNVRPVGDCFIEFIEPSADRPGGLSFNSLRASHPGVKPDGVVSFSVSGTASQEGEYQVVVPVNATAGVIPSVRKFAVAVAVRVWQPLALGPRRVKNRRADGKTCEAEFELDAGRPYSDGVDAQAVLIGFAGVRFIGVRFPGTTQFFSDQPSKKIGKEVASLDWTTPEILPKHKIPFTLLLESTAEKGKTAEEWDTVIQSIQFEFNQAIQKKADNLHSR
jgi:hypothetical protein